MQIYMSHNNFLLKIFQPRPRAVALRLHKNVPRFCEPIVPRMEHSGKYGSKVE